MKKLVFIGFFDEAWQDIVKFLEEKQFTDEAMLAHMKEVLSGSAEK